MVPMVPAPPPPGSPWATGRPHYGRPPSHAQWGGGGGGGGGGHDPPFRPDGGGRGGPTHSGYGGSDDGGGYDSGYGGGGGGMGGGGGGVGGGGGRAQSAHPGGRTQGRGAEPDYRAAEHHSSGPVHYEQTFRASGDGGGGGGRHYYGNGHSGNGHSGDGYNNGGATMRPTTAGAGGGGSGQRGGVNLSVSRHGSPFRGNERDRPGGHRATRAADPHGHQGHNSYRPPHGQHPAPPEFGTEALRRAKKHVAAAAAARGEGPGAEAEASYAVVGRCRLTQ
jgi:hypothetical protein